MSEAVGKNETVSLLQDLGLKEYESRCLLALTGCPSATAKEISERSDVPRTRVYDAVRVLEAQGLVEVQHTTPQRFRAVGVDEAAVTLRQRYDERIDEVRDRLETIEERDVPDESDQAHEVWSLGGRDGIRSRTLDLVERADDEIVLLVVDEGMLTDGFYERLHAAIDRDVDVVVGGLTADVVDAVAAELPGAETFRTELDWLLGTGDDGEVAISRLMLVDRSTLLVSSYYPDARGTESEERAVFADGLDNGVVVLVRRLIATGLGTAADPGM